MHGKKAGELLRGRALRHWRDEGQSAEMVRGENNGSGLRRLKIGSGPSTLEGNGWEGDGKIQRRNGELVGSRGKRKGGNRRRL